jgi:hypothetical protein
VLVAVGATSQNTAFQTQTLLPIHNLAQTALCGLETPLQDDERCFGTVTCIIDTLGRAAPGNNALSRRP